RSSQLGFRRRMRGMGSAGMKNKKLRTAKAQRTQRKDKRNFSGFFSFLPLCGSICVTGMTGGVMGELRVAQLTNRPSPSPLSTGAREPERHRIVYRFH